MADKSGPAYPSDADPGVSQRLLLAAMMMPWALAQVPTQANAMLARKDDPTALVRAARRALLAADALLQANLEPDVDPTKPALTVRAG